MPNGLSLENVSSMQARLTLKFTAVFPAPRTELGTKDRVGHIDK